MYTALDGLLPSRIGFNGWAEYTFDGPSMHVAYKSLSAAGAGMPSFTNATLLVTETFTGDAHGSGHMTSQAIVDKELTVVEHAGGSERRAQPISRK